jgi:enolase-phosphatase E1
MTRSPTTETVRAILLDIEGTTTPISFVHQVLFTYAREHLRSFLEEHFEAAELLLDLNGLRREYAVDLEQDQQPPTLISAPRDAEIDSLVVYINWLMDRDRKSRALKSLQGKIWKEGYLDGTLKAQLFVDVPPAFERWQRAGLSINIFSSGSALAQELLFAHTEAGDLTRFINNYFDTIIGAKKDAISYTGIAAKLGTPSRETLFISDVVDELDAAGAAGMRTLLCVRPGNPVQPATRRHQIIHTFNDIQ